LLKKTIFLDRDGIINRNRDDYVKNIEEMEILPNVPQAIRLLNSKNYHVVIISNQSAVNRGLLSIKTLNRIHEFLLEKLKEHGASIKAIYYCPHRPDESCTCRKPKAGLIFKAVEELDIDLKNSIMIGDRDSDFLAAKNAGIKFVLMETDGDLLATVNLILTHDG